MPRPSIGLDEGGTWERVASFVITARDDLDLSQQDLVELSGVSQSVVSKIENSRPDNGRFARDSLRYVALALLQHPDALIDLAQGMPVAEVREKSENYWNFCEDNGGWENWNKVPVKRLPRQVRQKRTQAGMLQQAFPELTDRNFARAAQDARGESVTKGEASKLPPVGETPIEEEGP